MKKISNKFHNNNGNNNTIYSLNYKFDSICSAGKFSGTALDLIKKYNELAKEAHSNGDYVEMEVFRQYAEHYRKIVTEINERKNQQRDNQRQNQDISQKGENRDVANEENCVNNLVETEAKETTASGKNAQVKEKSSDSVDVGAEQKTEKPQRRRRSFTIVEVSADQAQTLENVEMMKEKKERRRTATRTKKSDALGEGV